MSKVEIWVPIVKRIQPLSPSGYSYHPDIPCGVEFTTAYFDDDAMASPAVPFSSTYYIIVDAEDVAKCTKRIAEKDVPERDKHFRDMLRHCRGDMTKAAEFFEAIPAAESKKSPRAAMLADVIEQAEARLAKTHGAITAKAVADNIAKKLNAHVARAEKKAARS